MPTTIIDTCTDCDLLQIIADFCNPEVNDGGLKRVFFTCAGNGFTDVTDVNEWNAKLDNDTLADPTKIRYLHVIGSKPAPERSETTVSLNRKRNGKSKHSLNIKIDETTDVNYEFLQSLEGTTKQFAIWFETHGGKMYGGNNGVLAQISLDGIIPENSTEIETYEGKVTWEAIKSPNRSTSPFV
jgi:hypothetical protein